MHISEALERATKGQAEPAVWSDDRFVEAREHDLRERTVSFRAVVIANFVALGLAMLLTSGKLVEIAERQPFGESRDRWVSLAEGVDRVANFLSLNRPYDAITELRGFGNEAGQEFDSVDDLIEAREDLNVPSASAPVVVIPELPDSANPATSGAEGSTTSTAPATTTTTLPPAPEPIRTVTAADPLRVLVAGDSQSTYIYQSLLADTRGLPLKVEGRDLISTSLSRPDFFNWPAEAAAVADRESGPEAVVFFLGGNDYQDMVTGEGTVLTRGSPEWRTEWGRRLGILFDVLGADDTHVFWVGQPPMRDSDLNEGVAILNEISQAVIGTRTDVTMLSIWDQFGGAGPYQERIATPFGDIRARVDDGVHLTRDAAAWVSDDLVELLKRYWSFA